ncbi:MAG: 5'/3'-nucleotidase SurE [Chloroflexi bacterium]|nr:5'/3'-nucleotidase SurE [Chloroflexota bacterium]
MKHSLIVLTNDDGIRSPGLYALAREILKLGDVLIVAPLRQQTSMGRAFLGSGRVQKTDYRVDGRQVPAFGVAATPAVAVRNALMIYSERTPDLLVSGINYGENVGNGLTISATVCAALEGASMGVPALAVSQATPIDLHRSHSDAIDFQAAAYFARLFAGRILKRGMPPGADVLNVNVPNGASRKSRWKWTHASRNTYFRSRVREGKRGKYLQGYELNLDRETQERDSDVQAVVFDRVVSVTPLTYDLTARVSARERERWIK